MADRPVVVVTALARVTDALLALAPMVHAGRRRRRSTRRSPRSSTAMRQPPGSCRARPLALPAIAEDAAALRRELGAALGRMLRPAELDALAGRGELWSSRLVAAALEAAGLAATWVDIRADHGDRRSPRPRHAVHAGARGPGARVPPAAGRRGPDPGDPGLHRRHGRRHARPRSAAAAPTSPPRCSARRSTSSGSRSGPT